MEGKKDKVILKAITMFLSTSVIIDNSLFVLSAHFSIHISTVRHESFDKHLRNEKILIQSTH